MMARDDGKCFFWALLGLLLVCTGLVFAALSNPGRFSPDVHNDKYIDFFAGSGLLMTVVGVGLFVTAASRTTNSMPPRIIRNVNLGIGLGLTLQMAGLFLPGSLQLHDLAGTIMVIASLPLFVWGAMNYAMGKGQSKWFGLAGLLGLIGLVGLMLLPSRGEEESQAATEP